MEDQLLDLGFQVTNFLEYHLKNVSEDEDLDLQLTDMIFTLSMIQSESQEKIKLAQKSLIQNQDEIVTNANKLHAMLVDFKPLINEFVYEMVPPSLSTTNKELYQKMEEIIIYQSKIDKSLEMFDTVMQLDNIYECAYFQYCIIDYQRLIEDENLSELSKDIKKNHKILQLLLELPKMNPRCEQGEKICDLLKTYCITQFKSHFMGEKKLNFETKDLVEIMSHLNIQNEVVESYKISRVDQIKLQSVMVYLESKSFSVAQANQIISDFCAEINNEIIYLDSFLVHKPIFLQQYLESVIKYFNQNFFKKFFQSEVAYSPNNLFEIFLAWIQFYNFIHNLISKDIIDETQFQALLKIGVDPYKNIIPSLMQGEIGLMKQHVFKKLNNKEHINLKNPLEKLQDYEFQNIGEAMEQSFKRINDLCFSLSLEDWIFECVKLLDGYLLRMAGIIDEISQSIQQDSVGEFILAIMERIRLKKNKQSGISELIFYKDSFSFTKIQIQFAKKSKNILRSNFQTFEILLMKSADLQEFKMTSLIVLDQVIKTTVLKNTNGSVNNQDLIKSIYTILNDKIQNSRAASYLQSNLNQKQVNEYFSEISIVQSLGASIEQVEQKLISIILRLLLAEQYNQLVDGVEEDQVDQIVSQFTAHLEMIQKTIGQNIEELEIQNILNLYTALQLECQKLNQENISIQKDIYEVQIKELTDSYIKNKVFSPFTISWALLYATTLQILLQQAFKQGDQSIQVLKTQTDRILNNFILPSISQDIWSIM